MLFEEVKPFIIAVGENENGKGDVSLRNGYFRSICVQRKGW